jgi:hypothetical protein
VRNVAARSFGNARSAQRTADCASFAWLCPLSLPHFSALRTSHIDDCHVTVSLDNGETTSYRKRDWGNSMTTAHGTRDLTTSAKALQKATLPSKSAFWRHPRRAVEVENHVWLQPKRHSWVRVVYRANLASHLCNALAARKPAETTTTVRETVNADVAKGLHDCSGLPSMDIRHPHTTPATSLVEAASTLLLQRC